MGYVARFLAVIQIVVERFQNMTRMAYKRSQRDDTQVGVESLISFLLHSAVFIFAILTDC